ncbi:MAG: transcriptional regulator [Candidatus Omnitrophica bacterium 4484_171]|nr:MAG: transcriptional regulator [Candidatus Omnitrophica bacterium 4484_171]
MKHIGLKVKELRLNANLTQVELAKRIGVGLRFIRELEWGKPTIRLDKLNQVLKFFGYHIEVVKNGR